MSSERPIAVFEGKANGKYASIDEVAEAIIADPENSYHHVSIPLEGEIKISVSGPHRDPYNEKLILEYDGQKSEAPRMIEGHHAISTNYEDSCYLIVEVGTLEDPFLDRGVCWVYSGNSGILSIGIKTREIPLGPEQAKIALQRAIFRTTEVMSEILSGSKNPTIVDRH